ncbi:mechanosensitive ion channel family protein [Flavobacterium sp. DG1-102-2]|uniref:mechanosensitive ion channel family protein n=1 Tax=Flavobacterium sp. DG1-102-2 TaxID=3081663 RepID=UPI002949CA9B|nr:mechanosensitive ion channel family protein [Flavobacterium sp. DG1-102-2]MDV6168719.1 mechanosensitive ion channel family protein [Flavobacterium sp. DG1-102-2]
MIKKITSLFIILLFVCAANAQNRKDSAEIALQRLKAKNSLTRTKDSIKVALLKDELNSLINPKSKELEKYKNELLKIKQEDSLRLASQRESINTLRGKTTAFPVLLFQDTIFKIYSGFGPFSAEARANSAQALILQLYEDKQYQQDSLQIRAEKSYFNIIYKDKIITSISEEDALWADSAQDSLAKKYSDAIAGSIIKNRELHSAENSTLRWATAVGIFAAFLVIVFLGRKVYRFLFRRISHRRKGQASGIMIKNYQFLSAYRLKKVSLQLLKLFYFLLSLVFLYIFFGLEFSLFPATQQWASRLIAALWDPLKEIGVSIYHYIPKLLRIIVVLIVGRYADRFLRYLSIEIRRGNLKLKGFHTDWATPTYKLVRICLIIFTIVIVFPYLPGADTSAFKGISVFFGVLISLGSSSAISNTIAGFIITYMRPFQLGDWIKVDTITGKVIEKTALVTRLRTINNEDVTVPNSKILTNETINYSSANSEGLVIPITINVNYDVKQDTVQHLLLDAAAKTNDILSVPSPYVFKLALKETFVSYQLNAITKNPDRMYFIISDLNENILRSFNEAGIDILSPQFYPRHKG